jgi:hypothetical protein
VANRLVGSGPGVVRVPHRVRESAAILGLAGLMVVVAFFAAPGPPTGAWFEGVRHVVGARSADVERGARPSGASAAVERAGARERSEPELTPAADSSIGAPAPPVQHRGPAARRPRRRPVARQRVDEARPRAPRPMAASAPAPAPAPAARAQPSTTVPAASAPSAPGTQATADPGRSERTPPKRSLLGGTGLLS